MARTGFRSQMVSSAFQLSILPCMSFILTFILGIPRIQVFCIINQARVSRFFIRKPRPAPFLCHGSLILRWFLTFFRQTSYQQNGLEGVGAQRQRAWVVISARYSSAVFLNNLFSISVTFSVELSPPTYPFFIKLVISSQILMTYCTARTPAHQILKWSLLESKNCLICFHKIQWMQSISFIGRIRRSPWFL